MILANRYHDISCGHRVVGHEGKCKNLHGHNYRFHFSITAEGLDDLGRVIDFGIIKSTLCQWLEENWDHKMLIWDEDPWLLELLKIDKEVVVVNFNPTAENIAEYFVMQIAPKLLRHPVILTELTIEETRKCSVTFKI